MNQGKQSCLRIFWFAVALTSIPAVTLGFYTYRQRQPTSYRVPDDPPAVQLAGVAFPDGSAADVYRSTLRVGNEKSVRVLVDAIKVAEAQRAPDQAAIGKLRAELSKREDVLRTLAAADEARP